MTSHLAAADGCVLSFRGVGLRRGDRDVLADVDWTVADGERWVVLGPNGAGKSSVLQLAATYEFPSQGAVTVLGGRLGRTNVWDLRRRIGWSSASLGRLLRPELTSRQAVVTATRAVLTMFGQRFSDAEWERADMLLCQVELYDRADQRIDRLSEGERQRLQLARTLMPDPELLLLDEPTAGMDLGGREQLVAQLTRVQVGERLRAVVLVTHHVDEIPPGFTHALLLRAGRVLAAGPLNDVLTEDTLSACFDVPLQLERRDGRWLAWRAPTG